MAVELKQDQLNVIDLEEVGVALQATSDKIIILIDEYTSGYECKVCSGTGQVQSAINPEMKRSCDACKGIGRSLVIPDTAKSMPSTGVIVSVGPDTQVGKATKQVAFCEEALAANRKSGQQDWIEGAIEDLAAAKRELKECQIQIGTRVIFGVHVGTKIPIRGNIKLTIMREKEPLCVIFGSPVADSTILDYSQESY